MSKFLETLQNTEERTKQWIVIGASATVGLLVIWIWLGYFNNIVSPASVAAADNDTSISFLATARGGLAFVGNAILGRVAQLGGILAHIFFAPRSINIQPGSWNGIINE